MRRARARVSRRRRASCDAQRLDSPPYRRAVMWPGTRPGLPRGVACARHEDRTASLAHICERETIGKRLLSSVSQTTVESVSIPVCRGRFRRDFSAHFGVRVHHGVHTAWAILAHWRSGTVTGVSRPITESTRVSACSLASPSSGLRSRTGPCIPLNGPSHTCGERSARRRCEHLHAASLTSL